MTDGKATLTTEELDYDTQMNTGHYRNGGKVVTGKSVLTSRDATYYADLKDVYFRHDVKLKDPAYNLRTDSLLYNTDSQLATFISRTHIQDSSGMNTITSEGFYDMKNRKARLGKRSVIKDKALTITGNDIAMDDASGQFEVAGNAVLIDTTQGISVIANNIKTDRKNNTFLATLHPLMILKQDKDSIYITGDTLFAGRISDLKISRNPANQKDTIKTLTYLNSTDSSNRNRYFQAFHHVRIFSDSLQAVCDSLFYSGRDSIFQLFKNPVIWSSNTQVTGDTIYLFTKNKKAERLYVFENGMVINKSASNVFNQLRGNTLNAIFKDGNINFMRAEGSAESIYYGRDENNAFAGMNNASGDIIDMYFQDQEPKKVVFRTQVTGAFYPMGQIPQEKRTLRNFLWLENKRPKTRFELFEDILTQNETK
jgi:lipopolysaccharide export system protein LptA